MNNLESDIAKYRKKKDSSTSKSKAKSNHKHEYADCLFIENGRPDRGIYCKLCGKIGNVWFHETERLDNGMYRVLDDAEVFERHKNLEQIQIDSIWQKYIKM